MRVWLALGILLLAGCTQSEPAAAPEPEVDTPGPAAPMENATVENVTINPWALPAHWANQTKISLAHQGVGDQVIYFRVFHKDQTSCSYDWDGTAHTPDHRPGGAIQIGNANNWQGGAGGLLHVEAAGQRETVGSGNSFGVGGGGGRPATEGQVDITILLHGRTTEPQPIELNFEYECDEPFEIVAAEWGDELDLYAAATMQSTATAAASFASAVLVESVFVHEADGPRIAVLAAQGAGTGDWHIEGPTIDESFSLTPAGTHSIGEEMPGTWTSTVTRAESYGAGLWGAFYHHGEPFRPDI